MTVLYHADAARRANVGRALTTALEGEADVVFAYLHGSFLDASFHDIDVAVHLAGAPDAQSCRVVELAAQLSDRVGFPVDVRALNQAPVSFVFQALRGQLLFTRDDALLADRMERTVREYLDVAPLVRRATIEAFGP